MQELELAFAPTFINVIVWNNLNNLFVYYWYILCNKCYAVQLKIVRLSSTTKIKVLLLITYYQYLTLYTHTA